MTKVFFKTLNVLLNRKPAVPIKKPITPHKLKDGAYYYSTESERKFKKIFVKIPHFKIQRSKIVSKEPFDRRLKVNSWTRLVRKLVLVTFGTYLGVYTVLVLGAPEVDEDGEPIKDDLSGKHEVKQYIIRAWREFIYYAHLVSGPTTEQLLPDNLEYPYKQPKYTLVLELTDVLVHPEWSKGEGWRYKKRPLIQHFLETLKDSYEIVVYTAEHGRIVFPIVDSIDPNNIIFFRLVRGTTRYIKKLDNLNRDLSKVICVDWDSRNVADNPENLLKIKRWDGNTDDTSLLDLASFLKTIADNDMEDVRVVLKYYTKYDDPIAAFREKQERFIDELEHEAATSRGKRPFNISSIFKFNRPEE